MAVFMDVMNNVWGSKKLKQCLIIVIVEKYVCITVVVEQTFVVAWALICERQDLSEMECLMVSAITCLNDYVVLIGWRESRGEGQPD